MRRVLLRSALFGLSLAFAAIGPANASEVCSRLKSELASVSSGSASTVKYRRYANAVIKQTQQLQKVRSDLSRYGCSSGSIIVLGGKNASACAKLSAAQTKMRANLNKLERKRDSFSRTSSKSARLRIEAALKANDCDGKRAAIREAALKGQQEAEEFFLPKSPRQVTILDSSGDNTTPSPARQAAKSDIAKSAAGTRIVVEPKPRRGGNYRTLCVRSCDGFFFPVSSAASASDFARDERTCQMMCPGTPTALYYHSAIGEESEDMVSARTREPYTEMPNAFAYRNTGAPMSKACSCNITAFYKEMARREAVLNGEAEMDAPQTTWVRPFARPDPGEDPESNLDTEMRLTSEDVAAVLAASQIERPLTEERRAVRVVGPAFLPENNEDLDLKNSGESLIQ